jgi:hypothetical protein
MISTATAIVLYCFVGQPCDEAHAVEVHRFQTTALQCPQAALVSVPVGGRPLNGLEVKIICP